MRTDHKRAKKIETWCRSITQTKWNVLKIGMRLLSIISPLRSPVSRISS